jgi:monofunctional biosynthetic peptidoglycan transglycosylase
MDARKQQAKDAGRRYRLQWTWVRLNRISPHLQRAVLAAEDARFLLHRGVDWQGLKEAVAIDLEAGEFTHGGSTITQQLAKNLYLSTDRSFARKAKEAWIARSLERHLGKRRIFEIYLNVAEWGNGVYGAEAAARHHFGKPAADLTDAEAALLAAILPAPRRYDPLRVTQYIGARQQTILQEMNQVRLPK